MEKKVISANAYDKNCNGCIRNDAMCMLSLQDEEGDIHDFFLNEKEFIYLLNHLKIVEETNNNSILAWEQLQHERSK